MEHVVFYPATDGTPAFERVNSLDEAVAFAERLRNSSGISEFSVHAMTPVPVSFRAYYHVEIPESERPLAAAEPVPVAETTESATEPATAEALAPVEASVAPEAVVVEPAVEAVVEPVGSESSDAAEPAGADTASTDDVVVDESAPAAVEETLIALVPDPEPEVADAVDDDRSEEWVAEAEVREPSPVVAVTPEVDEPEVPAVAPSAPIAPSTPFADAPPVTPAGDAAIAETESGTADVVPIPQGRRSMGFFSR